VTCQNLPLGVTCSPLTINETNASTPASGALTINVLAPSRTTTASLEQANRTYMAQATHTPTNARLWSGGAGLAALLLLCVPRKRMRSAMAIGLIWVLGFTVSCGGGSSGGGGGTTTPPVPTSTQLSVSSTKVAANGSITVSATVTGGAPSGNVQFVIDGTVVGGLAPLTNGTTGNITVTAATAPAFLPIVGTHSLTARYLGSSGTQPSQSGTINAAVTGTTSFGITGTAATTTSNGSVSLTIN